MSSKGFDCTFVKTFLILLDLCATARNSVETFFLTSSEVKVAIEVQRTIKKQGIPSELTQYISKVVQASRIRSCLWNLRGALQSVYVESALLTAG